MSVKAVLDTFGASLVKQSRANLTRKKKKASGALYKSLDYEVKESKNSFQFSFLMEDHGDFVDKGVKGVGGTKADGTNWKKKKVTNNKYKYFKKKPPISMLNGWTIRKGIAPRNKKGRFTKRKGLLFAIVTSIFHTGLETTSFYSRPFDLAFKKLPDDVVEAYGLELDKFLEASIK